MVHNDEKGAQDRPLALRLATMSDSGSRDEDKYAASTAVNTPLSISMAGSQDLYPSTDARYQVNLNGSGMEEATVREKALRDHVREIGDPIGSGSSGMLERKEIVDFGSGPEEVIVIDWMAGSPEVNLETGPN